MSSKDLYKQAKAAEDAERVEAEAAERQKHQNEVHAEIFGHIVPVLVFIGALLCALLVFGK